MKNYNPHIKNLELLKATAPKMRYNKNTNFEEWQIKTKNKLTELLGLPFTECDFLLEIEYEKQHEDFREIRFTFQSESGYFVPCHLLIPDDYMKPTPLVLCLQGHSTGMHNSMGRVKFEDDGKSFRSYGLQALEQGWRFFSLPGTSILLI